MNLRKIREEMLKKMEFNKNDYLINLNSLKAAMFDAIAEYSLEKDCDTNYLRMIVTENLNVLSMIENIGENMGE